MDRRYRTSCYYCNEEGHIQRDCPKKKKDYLSRVRCFQCGATGHMKRDCPKLRDQYLAEPTQCTEDTKKTSSNASRTTSKPLSSGGVDRTSKDGDKVTSPKQNLPPTPTINVDSKSEERDVPVSPVSSTANHESTNSAAQPNHTSSSQESSSSSQQLASVKDKASTGDTPHSSLKLPSRDQQPSARKKIPYPPFVDTHCHLEYVFNRYEHHGNFRAFSNWLNYPKNFDGCISTFCDPAAFSSSFGLWSDLLSEPNVWGAFGIHPHNAKYYYSNGTELEGKMLECLEHQSCVAFGEIGLDYSDHSPSDPQTQRDIFEHQLQLGLMFHKPLLLHCRNAEEELHHLLSKNVPSDWLIHLHCYTGKVDKAKQFLEEFPNLYLGVCGNVTYERSFNLRKVASEVPLNRLLVETDAPYMVPYNLPRAGRCRFSHPALAFYVAKEIARLRREDLVHVLQQVRENTKTVYGI